MKKILITGGAGYIGSMLSSELVKKGYFVTVVDLIKYDKKSLEHLNYHKNFSLIKADIRNFRLMKKLIGKNEFIIPLAALVGAPLCERNKKEAISVNYESIKNLNKTFKEKKKILFNN